VLYIMQVLVLCPSRMTGKSKAVNTHNHTYCSRLGGVVVSVLATGPKGRGFKPGRGAGVLRAIKIGSTPSFGYEVKPEVPYRKFVRHVKDPLRYFRY
jgi:hypothetical protein